MPWQTFSLGIFKTLYVTARISRADATWAEIAASLQNLSTRVQWTELDATQGSKTVQTNWARNIRDRQVTAKDIRALGTFLQNQSIDADSEARRAGSLEAI